MSTATGVLRRRWRQPPVSVGVARGAGPAVAALAVANVVGNRCVPAPVYVPWNLAVAGGMVQLARRAGKDLEDLGLGRDALGGALRAGAAGTVLVGVSYAALALTGWRGTFLRDSRLTALDTRSALFHLVVRIPIGTALAEEVMFRSVLPALLASPRRPPWFPSVSASVLFGLWHVLPSHDRSRANADSDASRTPAREMASTVGATAIAGGVLDLARRRTGHLAAPVLLHVAANAFGFLAVRLADGRR